MDNKNYEQLGVATEKKIGNVFYIVKAFGNKNATKTAQDLLMEIAEKKLQKDINNGEFYKKLKNEQF
jgi:hypothetical protein